MKGSNPSYPPATCCTNTFSSSKPCSSLKQRKLSPQEEKETGTAWTSGLRQSLINVRDWYPIKIITFHQNEHSLGYPCQQGTGRRGCLEKKIFEEQKPFPVIHAHSKSLGEGGVYLEFQFGLQQVWAQEGCWAGGEEA